MSELDALRLLGIGEIATLLGTHRREVTELIESGVLPCLRVGVTREPRVSRAMLESWMSALGRGEIAGQITAQKRRVSGGFKGRLVPVRVRE